MFIPKNYVLSSELSKLGNINISNFSNQYNYLENSEQLEGVALRYGDCTFFNMSPHTPYGLIPNNFKEIYQQHKDTITNLENCILASELERTTGITKSNLSYIKEYNPEQFEVCNKTFWRFSDEFREKLKGKNLTIIKNSELDELVNENLIDDYIRISTTRLVVLW